MFARFRQNNFSVVHLRRHDIALLERAVEQHARRLIGDRALDGPAQRPRAVHGVIPRGRERICTFFIL